jgi:hypothetical protein
MSYQRADVEVWEHYTALKNRSHYVPLDLVSILLQNDTHQLTARPDSSFGEELLKRGFDGALGDSDPRCNFLVGETLEYK